MSPCGRSTSQSAVATWRKEIKERSATTTSKSPTMSTVMVRAFVESSIVTLGSRTKRSCSWDFPTSSDTTSAAPCCNTQSVKPPVEAPTSKTRLLVNATLNESNAASSFSPPRETKRAGVDNNTLSEFAIIRLSVSAIDPFTKIKPCSIKVLACAASDAIPCLTNQASNRKRAFDIRL